MKGLDVILMYLTPLEQEQFEKNTIEYNGKAHLTYVLDTDYEDHAIHDVIDWGFSWASSREGESYWIDIYERVSRKQDKPDFPGSTAFKNAAKGDVSELNELFKIIE